MLQNCSSFNSLPVLYTLIHLSPLGIVLSKAGLKNCCTFNWDAHKRVHSKQIGMFFFTLILYQTYFVSNNIRSSHHFVQIILLTLLFLVGCLFETSLWGLCHVPLFKWLFVHCWGNPTHKGRVKDVKCIILSWCC